MSSLRKIAPVWTCDKIPLCLVEFCPYLKVYYCPEKLVMEKQPKTTRDDTENQSIVFLSLRSPFFAFPGRAQFSVSSRRLGTRPDAPCPSAGHAASVFGTWSTASHGAGPDGVFCSSWPSSNRTPGRHIPHLDSTEKRRKNKKEKIKKTTKMTNCEYESHTDEIRLFPLFLRSFSFIVSCNV